MIRRDRTADRPNDEDRDIAAVPVERPGRAPRHRSSVSFTEEDLKPASSHPAMNPFLPFLAASFVAACGWTILVLAIDQRNRRFVGLIGAWAATVVLAALWQAEAVPWLWVLLQGVLLVWLSAVALLIAAVASIWRVTEPGRSPLLFCAVLSLVVNVAAGLQFLWLATVSPGGA